MKRVPDIYFLPEYGRLFEDVEQGDFHEFNYRCQYGAVVYQFIKRPISLSEGRLFDLITPYGYGGPLVMECEEGSRTQLVEAFVKRFREYCMDENVISEFIRFHPILNNQKDFASIYNVSFVRKTLATNLQDYGDPLEGEFTGTCRKTIRRARRAGLKVELDFSCDTVSDFCRIYESTMDRNRAASFYYFKPEFFVNTIQALKEHVFIANAIYDGEIVAAGLYMHYGDYMHAHFSGTLDGFLKWSPANLLKAEVATWGHSNGKRFFHHGGGTTNSEEDGLYQFKKRFSRNTSFRFCIGRNIWDKQMYTELCTRAEGVRPLVRQDFFPLYRA